MAEFRELASGLRFPEGPVVMQDGSVLVTEIGGSCITRILPGGNVQQIAELAGGPNGAAVGPDGALYVCNNGGSRFQIVDNIWWSVEAHDVPDGWIERVDIASGRSERLYDKFEDQNLSRPNDIVFDAHGGFYFTAIGRDWGTHRTHGAIYYAKTDGSSIERVVDKLISPNGIGLSPDGSRLYFAETYTSRVLSIPLSGPGEAAPLPRPHRAEFVGHLASTSLFDSLAVMADGAIAVATMIDNSGITIFEPQGGSYEQIPAPDPIVTNIAFGGADMRTGYVTASGYGRLLMREFDRPGLRLHFNA